MSDLTLPTVLVAHLNCHLVWLCLKVAMMCHCSLWKLSLDPADVLLEDLPVPDLLLHVAGLAGVAPEHEQAGRQPVQRNEIEYPDEVLLESFPH